MNQKPVKGLLKHIDFIIMDLVVMQVCFVLAYWVRSGYGNPYRQNTFIYLAEMLALSQLLVIMFGGGYTLSEL